jgi:sporulation protein YlmC with PRC-barrel domain
VSGLRETQGCVQKENAKREAKTKYGKQIQMKHKLQMVISASAASVLAFSALAQDTPNPKPERPDYIHAGMPHTQRPDRLNDAAKASDLLGMTVKNYQDEKLGKVEDLAVDVESGRIVQVILSTGGFIGIGDRLTAVPPGAMHRDVTNKVLHLEADKAKLKAAPEFEMSKWAEYCDSEHLSGVYRYFGQERAFKFIQTGETVPDGQSNTDGSANTVPARKADGTWDKDHSSNNSQCMIPVSRLSQIQKASKLIGTPVNNLQEEKLGKVENMLVDLPSGRLVAIIVSSGGFLGMGDELSAVPPTALRFNTERDTLRLDASKEMLSSAPHFKANQWPDFAQPSYAGGVYRAYKVEPYFTSDTTAGTDNSTLTSPAQGNSQADVNTTARIRQEINAGKDLSVNARNVKVTTLDGRVTLQGPVNTAEEKAFIAAIANKIAKSENVDNQLEVKLTATGRS